MASRGSMGNARSLVVTITLLIASLGVLLTSPASASGPTDVSGIISQDTTWSLDGSPYIVTGNLLVARGATLTVEAGVEVRFSSDLYLKVEGAINATGSEGASIVFTSNSDTPEMLDWRCIEFAPSSDDANCTLVHCEIEYAETPVLCVDASPRISRCVVSRCYDGILCDGRSEPVIDNNTVRDNLMTGIQLGDGTAIVSDNRVINNRWVGIGCDRGSAPIIHNNTVSNSTRGIDSTRGLPRIVHNTVTDCEDGIFLHETSCWLWNNTVVGNDNGLHITGDSGPDIAHNNILNNTDYEVRCESERDVHAPHNYWGTTDVSELRERIYDYQDDFNFGNFTVTPFLDGPSPGAPDIPVASDRDGDGVPDELDAFPDDPSEWNDTDEDGVGDNGDAFPGDPAEWLDTDGDGVGDNGDAFPGDPSEWNDTDEDGVGDNSDAFPGDRAASLDRDSDGHPDEWNPGMTGRDSMTGLTLDEFPDDPGRWSREEDEVPVLPVALVVVAVCLSCLLGVGATEVGRAKLFAIAFPAYSRLKGQSVLDQFTRGQIYGLVRGNPGINYTTVLETLEIGNGTLAYHLSVLEKEGFIRSQTRGTRKLFYPTRLPARHRDLEERFPSGEERDHTLSELQEGIVAMVRDDPGVTQAEIVSRLKVPKQTVSYNVRNLESYGILEVRTEGKTARCYPK